MLETSIVNVPERGRSILSYHQAIENHFCCLISPKGFYHVLYWNFLYCLFTLDKMKSPPVVFQVTSMFKCVKRNNLAKQQDITIYQNITSKSIFKCIISKQCMYDRPKLDSNDVYKRLTHVKGVVSIIICKCENIFLTCMLLTSILKAQAQSSP